tara:strand:+ start:3249 stop:3518 length:270 start_codon:yes stop_codon:yes gene_type:complete
MTKAKTKTERVALLIAQGKSVKEIVRTAKVSAQLVYGVKSKMRKAGCVEYASGIAGLSNRATPIRTHDEPVVDAPKETFWRKVWRIIWK